QRFMLEVAKHPVKRMALQPLCPLVEIVIAVRAATQSQIAIVRRFDQGRRSVELVQVPAAHCNTVVTQHLVCFFGEPTSVPKLESNQTVPWQALHETSQEPGVLLQKWRQLKKRRPEKLPKLVANTEECLDSHRAVPQF